MAEVLVEVQDKNLCNGPNPSSRTLNIVTLISTASSIEHIPQNQQFF